MVRMRSVLTEAKVETKEIANIRFKAKIRLKNQFKYP
jgi:hypothetical protein